LGTPPRHGGPHPLWGPPLPWGTSLSRGHLSTTGTPPPWGPSQPRGPIPGPLPGSVPHRSRRFCPVLPCPPRRGPGPPHPVPRRDRPRDSPIFFKALPGWRGPPEPSGGERGCPGGGRAFLPQIMVRGRCPGTPGAAGAPGRCSRAGRRRRTGLGLGWDRGRARGGTGRSHIAARAALTLCAGPGGAVAAGGGLRRDGAAPGLVCTGRGPYRDGAAPGLVCTGRLLHREGSALGLVCTVRGLYRGWSALGGVCTGTGLHWEGSAPGPVCPGGRSAPGTGRGPAVHPRSCSARGNGTGGSRSALGRAHRAALPWKGPGVPTPPGVHLHPGPAQGTSQSRPGDPALLGGHSYLLPVPPRYHRWGPRGPPPPAWGQ